MIVEVASVADLWRHFKMAARIKSSSGINGNLFPTEFPVNNKLYKLFVKLSAIPLISDHRFSLVIFKTFFVIVKNSQHFNRQITRLKRRLFLAPKILTYTQTNMFSYRD